MVRLLFGLFRRIGWARMAAHICDCNRNLNGVTKKLRSLLKIASLANQCSHSAVMHPSNNYKFLILMRIHKVKSVLSICLSVCDVAVNW